MCVPNYVLTAVLVLAICAGSSTEQVIADDVKPTVTIDEIKKAWQMQMDATPKFEIVLTQTVDIPPADANRTAEQMRSLGREVHLYPTHRKEQTRLIVQSERMLMEHEIFLPDEPGNKKSTIFYDGSKQSFLRESSPADNDGKRQRIGTVRDGLPTNIIAQLSLRPIFLTLRGANSSLSHVDLDDYRITEQDEQTVTLRGNSGEELILSRNRGLMPIRICRLNGQEITWEIKITYKGSDKPPYFPDGWSLAMFHPEGVTTQVSKRESFALDPTVDLATYQLEFGDAIRVRQ